MRIADAAKRTGRLAFRLAGCRWQDWKRKVLHQYFPPKPTVINLNANDICNSKCTMCNIWQRKKDFEISPHQLFEILDNPFFSRVRHVGITGGEPTLRSDLPQLYDSVCRAIPQIQGLSIITNAIRENQVIERIQAVQSVCQKHKKDFSVMVSLDGVGSVHDLIRGRDGNFEAAIRVIRFFKHQTTIPITIGCTITKENVWDVDDLLLFLRNEGLEGRFRVAEFIDRLYNNELTSVIRNFDEEESYHLACFFKKIECEFETNETYRRTYRSIIKMLNGGKRTIGCPYHNKGLVLDSREDIQFCAPKSPAIGNALKHPAKELFRSNLKQRRRILQDKCDDCIHDYHAPITYSEAKGYYQDLFWKELIQINRIRYAQWLKPLGLLGKKRKKGRIVITGWYGTETVGDKAILGNIIELFRKTDPQCHVTVTSFYPFVTQKTLSELGLNTEVVSVYSYDFLMAIRNAEKVILGGGPLMDMEALAIPLWAFTLARIFGGETIVFGCGIGPVNSTKYANTIKRILELANEVKLRDSGSVEISKKWLPNLRSEMVGDPARAFLRSARHNFPKPPRKPVLACFLREWTAEYGQGLSTLEFQVRRSAFEDKMAQVIKAICKDHNLLPTFYPMHTFFVGNDDRDFYRRFLAQHFEREKHTFYKYNANPDLIADSMNSSQMCICMRFHSVLFAETLGVNYFAIDYTNGGKISAFLRDQGRSDRMISLDGFITSSMDEILERINMGPDLKNAYENSSD